MAGEPKIGGDEPAWIVRHEPAWYAVHTRSRHEQKAQQELSRKGFEVFLPQVWGWSRRRDRRKRIKKALFPGYLFVRTPLLPGVRLSIIQSKAVVRILEVRQRPVPVPERVVESVRLLVEGSSDAGPHPLVNEGKLVQVVEGPLAGAVGRVVRVRRRRLVVNVELLGRAVAATIDDAAVAPYLGE
ncbi:MAG: UpxY family transcription antiterminator [Deltaproteobacteria bacterium]|nr:MAG: UpxY family transcription antiterminator [Deltaproteobacteria bacterium]